MSAETKYLVMEELIGVPAAAIEKAEEQASRIIEMVKGEGRFARPKFDKSESEPLLGYRQMVEAAYPPDGESHPEATEYKSSASDENIRHPEFRPKHTTKPTKESLKLTEKIVSLRAKGLHWHQIAAKVGLSKEAARKRYREWEKKNVIELYEPGAEEAQQEAEAAERWAALKKQTVDEMIASMDSQNALDIEILQAVRRQFPGCSLTVADIRARRHS